VLFDVVVVVEQRWFDDAYDESVLWRTRRPCPQRHKRTL